ncbi:MAG: hypothetical protein PSN04_05615 [Methyloprofundus sp.]|nr:hypothetical protein [Methyloprofundus sp.]
MSMSEKSVHSSLHQIEQQLADKNPALLQAFRLYHELDQVAYEMNLIGMDDSLANKTSWSPIISVLGEPSSGKNEFINQYLAGPTPLANSDQIGAQFSVLSYRNSETSMTLPGTAVDGDPRFPFFHISDRLEQMDKGEGRNINIYLDLKTSNSQKLKDKTIITAPGFSFHDHQEGVDLLRNHVSNLSDLVFIFFDANKFTIDDFKVTLPPFLKHAANSHNPSKFIYIITENNELASEETIANWKHQLTKLGLQAGQFISLSSSTSPQEALEQKLSNIDIESAYRILSNLEEHITDFEDVIVHEVTKGLVRWKERTHFTLTLLLSFIALTLVAGEIQFGLVAILLDPFIASTGLFLLLTALVPFHLSSSKFHAKFIMKDLEKRQHELGLTENLPALFTQNMTFWRIMLPTTTPVAWTKEVQETLGMILTRAKGLVQSLNNSFNSSQSTSSISSSETFLNL